MLRACMHLSYASSFISLQNSKPGQARSQTDSIERLGLSYLGPKLYIQERVQWWKLVMDETRNAESLTNFTLEASMNTFIMQLNNALEDFDTFFSRAHSTSSFRTVKFRGHWTDQNDFQRSITRFDHCQSQINTCSYGSWSFSCMIIDYHDSWNHD